jgi:hypothetical protein
MNSSNLLKTIMKLQNNFINNKPINILFCDVQDKYINKIYNYKDVINTTEDIAEASKILQLNQIVTEHKKDIFGVTIPEIRKHFYDKTILFEKTRFAMLDDEYLTKDDKEAVYVLLGIEGHVCITQTALNILKNDRDLIILSDGVSSANEGDRNVALKNLMNLGAYVTTSQSFLFLLLKDAKHPKFKSLLPILKRFSERDNKLLNAAKF